MAWLVRFLNSSIGLKILMAISGLMLVGFLIGHLSGNLLVYAGPDAINNYARTLREYMPILWVLRVGTLFAFLIHVYTGIKLTRMNRAASSRAYQVNNPQKASLGSRTMALSGLVVLSFVLFHLAHLTFKWTHPEFSVLGDYDVYSMLLVSFHSPVVSLFYIISVSLLMFHLNHGLTSLFQTLGLYHKKHSPMIRTVGPLFSSALALGFISIPLSIWLGFIQ